MYLLAILIISIITGFSSGMFGIGGSVLATPLLLIFTDISSKSALSTPLPVAISSALSGSVLYFSKKLIDFRLALFTLIFAFPFSFLGSYLANEINITYLLIAKAMVLLFLGLKYFFTNNFEYKESHNHKITFIALTGAIAGFIAGILALGGGIVFVTAFRKLLRINLKKSIGTSLFCVGILAIINTFQHIIFGMIDIKTALLMMILVLPFSYLGAKISVKLKNKTITLLFGTTLILFSLYFIIKLLG